MRISHKLVLFSVFLLGCNSGGPNLYAAGGGQRCGPDGAADPIQTDLSNFPGYTKADWSDLTAAAQTGTLTYAGAMLYILDGPSQFSVEVSDGQNPAIPGSFTPGTVCARNYANIARLSSQSKSIQFMSGLTYSQGVWSTSARTLGFAMNGKQLQPIASDVTSENNGTAVDPQSLFKDFVTASPGFQTTMGVWCVGSCSDTDKTKTYQVRASRISTTAPFDKTEIVSVYTWTRAASGQ